MAKYQTLMDEIRQLIAKGIWLPGDKLPSLREQVARSGMSLMTVMHAYQVLESIGILISRPKSGYYVAPLAIFSPQSTAQQKVQLAESVDINAFIYDVLRAIQNPAIFPFASAFPDPELFPHRALMRSLNTVAGRMKPEDALDNLPPGNKALRKMLAQRYAMQGMAVNPDEIVITNGALEALNLSLQAVTEPGDWIVVENPCFYGALQAVERLKLRVVAITSDPEHGLDLEALREALSRRPIKACWLMTNYQNPSGCSLSDEKKAQLVSLLQDNDVFLIEDDVYAELSYESKRLRPARYWDSQDTVLHCSSFSKNLVAGFRVGWVAAGRHATKIQRLQLMSTLSTSVPVQLALYHYLSSNRYEQHLSRLRRSLAQRKMQARSALVRWLPPEVRINDISGGYFLWIALPPGMDAMQLFHQALKHNISLAPGKMFSSGDQYANYFRFNTSWAWGEKQELAVKILGELIHSQLREQENYFASPETGSRAPQAR